MTSADCLDEYLFGSFSSVECRVQTTFNKIFCMFHAITRHMYIENWRACIYNTVLRQAPAYNPQHFVSEQFSMYLSRPENINAPK